MTGSWEQFSKCHKHIFTHTHAHTQAHITRKRLSSSSSSFLLPDLLMKSAASSSPKKRALSLTVISPRRRQLMLNDTGTIHRRAVYCYKYMYCNRQHISSQKTGLFQPDLFMVHFTFKGSTVPQWRCIEWWCWWGEREKGGEMNVTAEPSKSKE